MSPDQERNNRQTELYRVIGEVASFAMNRLYVDETQALSHLQAAIRELQSAHKLLVWDRPRAPHSQTRCTGPQSMLWPNG